MDFYLCNNKIGDNPLIAGSLNDKDVSDLPLFAVSPVDIVELRVDMFEDLTPAHIESIFKKAREKFRKPIIATVRDPREGGAKEVPDRAGVYTLIAPHAEMLDVEVVCEDLLRHAAKLCRDGRKLLIGSYHNFEATPGDNFLESVFAGGRELGADIIKLAVAAGDREDLLRLLAFTLRHREDGLITISMGDAGMSSRVFNPLCGSLITYGYISHPSAPGQLSISELLYIFRRLKIRN